MGGRDSNRHKGKETGPRGEEDARSQEEVKTCEMCIRCLFRNSCKTPLL